MVSDEKYNEHIKCKNTARDESEKDKANEKFVFTMNCQSDVSSMYYKAKRITIISI